MRVRHTVNVSISEDDDGKNVLFGLDETLAKGVLDGFAEMHSGAVNLTLAGGEYTIPLGGVSDVRGFYLRADNNFDLNLNGITQSIIVTRGKAGYTGEATSNADWTDAKVFMEALITEIQVTPAADLRLFWAVWGDPLA